MQPKGNSRSAESAEDEISQEVRNAVKSDLRILAKWVEEFGADRLKSLCATIADIAKHRPNDIATECTKVLATVLPPEAVRIMRQLLQKCQPDWLKLVKDSAPKEIANCLKEIVVLFSPWIVAAASPQGPSYTWRRLDCTLAEDQDGDLGLNLRFHREDGKAFFVQGSPQTAIGQVLPKIMATLARAAAFELDDDDVKAYTEAQQQLHERIIESRAQTRSRDSNLEKSRKRGKSA